MVFYIWISKKQEKKKKKKLDFFLPVKFFFWNFKMLIEWYKQQWKQ